MIEEADYTNLTEAADQAGFLGHTSHDLQKDPVQAKELAESILSDTNRKVRVSKVHLPVLEAFSGINLSSDQISESAENDYYRSR